MTEQRVVKPYPTDDHDHHDDMFNLGLQADTNMLGRSPLDRRKVLALGAAGIGLLLAGCDTTTASTGTGNTDTGTGSGGSGSSTCAAQPAETQGPYPADGSSASGQTLNILDDSGIVRTDLRTSFGTGNTAAGVPLTLTLNLVNVNSNCAALSGYVVYIWHCTASGKYSMYSTGLTSEDYLRGAAVTDSSGQITFTTVVPGCYSGRWPHIHFEVYKNLAAATTGNVNKNCLLVSQMALPQATAAAVYADSRYTGSLNNLNSISLSSDNVFSDGYSTQMLTMSGSNSAGYTASMTIGLSV